MEIIQDMQKKIVSFDGTKINYDISRNKGNKEFLVFIHGAGGNLSAWKEERSFFHKKGYSTVAIDLRGHGKSGRPHLAVDYGLDNFAKDIHHILQYENIDDFSIVGHCFGGMITITYHKLFPIKSRSYILIGTTYKAPPFLKKIFNPDSSFISIINNILEKRSLEKEYLTDVDFKKFVGTGDYNLRRITSDIYHTSLKSWIFTYESLAKYDGTDIMKTIEQPVLIIEGEKDTIFNVTKAKKINRLIRNSTLKIVPKANHIIVLNNPEAIQSEMLRFMSL